MMSQQTDELTKAIQEKADEYIQSIIYYNNGDFDLVYVRDDVVELYDVNRVEEIVHELSIESIEKNIKERLYPHGNLKSTIMWFERGIELYLHIGENEGFAVGLDAEAFAVEGPFADELYEVVNSVM